MMSSQGSAQPTDFVLNYKNLDVQEYESPNMIIYHTIEIKQNHDNLFLKINGIEYDVEIREIIKSNQNENPIINLYKTYSHGISFFSSKKSAERSVLIKFPANEFTKLVSSKLINGKFTFNIVCQIDYEIYHLVNGYYYLKHVSRSALTYIQSLGNEYRIEPSDDQISLVINKNKYTSKLGMNLSLLDEPLNNQALSSAVNNLKLAAQGFIEGDFNTVIVNTRNALANSLTEIAKTNSSSSRNRALKNEIKEACLKNIPTKDMTDYNDILKYVGNIASSLLSINHKYAHENQNTIKMRPLHADLELLYFSTSLLTKYLTRLNNGKL
ncbi:MAG: hypothetical protein WBQ25_24815 [Nitrososphaeraceae archaeon]